MNKAIVIALITGGMVSAADKDKVLAGEPLTTSRTIAYHASEIAMVNAEMNFSTMIIFDKSEKILVGACGDDDHWYLEHAENVITIKPKDSSARGASTNVNVVMGSGNVYSFVVHEISTTPGAHADLKIFVNPGDENLLNATKKKLFVSAEEAEADHQKAIDLEKQLAQQKTADQSKIRDAQNSAPQHIRHDYKFDAKKAGKKPLNISAIYTLNGFTHIEGSPEETPVVYEVKDGKPSLIQFDFRHGVYTIPKVLDEGYLSIGKAKLTFKLEDKS